MLHTDNAQEDSRESQFCQPQAAEHEPESYQDPVTGAHFRFRDVCLKLLKLAQQREKQERLERVSTQASIKELSPAGTIVLQPEPLPDCAGLCFNTMPISVQSDAKKRVSARPSNGKGDIKRFINNNRKTGGRRDEQPLTLRTLRPVSLSPLGMYSARGASSSSRKAPLALAKRVASPRPNGPSLGSPDKRTLTSSAGFYRTSVGGKVASYASIQARRSLGSVVKRAEKQQQQRTHGEKEMFTENCRTARRTTYHRQTSSLAGYAAKVRPVIVKTRVQVGKRRMPAAVETYGTTVLA